MKPQIVNEKMKKLLLQSRIIKAAIFVVITAAALLLTGALYFRDTVYITDEGVTREIKTNQFDTYAILKSDNYVLEPDDTVSVQTSSDKKKHIIINRAFGITINVDGEEHLLITESYTLIKTLQGTEDRLPHHTKIVRKRDGYYYFTALLPQELKI